MNRNKDKQKELYKTWHYDAANWRAGFLYFNRKDRRLLVPRRWGIGWTFNFANPLSVMLLLLLLGIPVLMAVIFS